MKPALFAATSNMTLWTSDGKLVRTLQKGEVFVRLRSEPRPGSLRTQVLTSSGIFEIYLSKGHVIRFYGPPE